MKKYHWNTHKIVQETEDTISIYFDTNTEVFPFIPGQFININCLIDSVSTIRSYSLSSSPTDKYPCITVKRVEGGLMSNYLVDNAASITEWDIQGPFGNFVLDKEISEQFPIVFLGGGSGISPLLSMLESISTNVNIPLLLYSNKSPEQTIFREALLDKATKGELTAHYSFTNQEVNTTQPNHISGRFSIESIQAIIKQHTPLYTEAHYYICGPTGLMNLYQEALSSLNIDEKNIHAEFFDIETEEEISIVGNDVSRDIFVHYFEDTLVNDDVQTYECTAMVEVKSNQSLLEAIKEHKISVPSSCKNGTCGACWAIKMDGEVHMISNRVLTESNITEGIILLCQSYPMDEDVTISLLG